MLGWPLHNEELHDLYFSPCIIQKVRSRKIKWEGHVSHIRERRGAGMVLAGNLRERRIQDFGGKPHVRPRHRWKNNIKICPQTINWLGGEHELNLSGSG
jgi:hypothetical protein